MKLYVYCLTEGVDTLPEKLQGIGGAQVRLFQTENFSLLVSGFAGDSVPVNRENALVHAAVVRSVLNQTTPLPFRFGTLVSEEQLRNYLNARREALLENFARIRGCVEMSVKILLELKDREPGQTAVETPGTAFLLEKRREILGSEEIASWLGGQIGDSVRGTTIKTNLTNQLLLSAAHLVERDGIEEYRRRLKEARAARPELKFLTSGPWPPYSFANIDLEFHTQFGVS